MAESLDISMTRLEKQINDILIFRHTHTEVEKKFNYFSHIHLLWYRKICINKNLYYGAQKF